MQKARERKVASIRIYSDWTLCPKQKRWQAFFAHEEVTCIQIGRTIEGKNSLDHALFDVALLMPEKKQKYFIIVTSDTDFTQLAQTLHQTGDTYVIGIGHNEKDVGLQMAYDEFYCYTGDKTTKSVLLEERYQKVAVWLEKIFYEVADGQKWIPLSDIGNVLKKKYPQYKFPVNYPAKLKQIIELHHAEFALKRIGTLYYIMHRREEAKALKNEPVAFIQKDRTAQIELGVKWRIALLLLHEGMENNFVQRITDLVDQEIEELSELLKKIRVSFAKKLLTIPLDFCRIVIRIVTISDLLWFKSDPIVLPYWQIESK